MTIVEIDKDGFPSDILNFGFGCDACIIEQLVVLLQSGKFTHNNVGRVH